MKSFIPDREEPGCETLRELGLHLPRILDNLLLRNVDVFDFQRHDRPVTNAGKQRESDECLVAAINVVSARNGAKHIQDLRNVGTRFSVTALAMRVSFSDKLK